MVQLISYKEIPFTAVLLIVFLMRWLLAPPSLKWGWLFTVLLSFIVTGLGLAVYLNMPEPQPRERVYVFVGSFFAYAIWVGIGVSVLIELVAEAIKTEIEKSMLSKS